LINAVKLHFKYSEEEYVAATRHYYQNFHAKVSAVFSLLILMVGLLAWLISDDAYIASFLMAGGLFFLVIYFLNYFAWPKRIYRRNPKLREEYDLQFSEGGIIFRAKGIDSILKWDLYQEVRETDQFYYLIYGRDSFTVIPKRVFVSARQERDFRALLRAHVDQNVNPDALIGDGEKEYVPTSLGPPDWR
jgi:hypothetical protein